MSSEFDLEKWIDTDLLPYFDENRRWSLCDLRAIYVRAFCKGQEQAAKRDEDMQKLEDDLKAWISARDLQDFKDYQDEARNSSFSISTFKTLNDDVEITISIVEAEVGK